MKIVSRECVQASGDGQSVRRKVLSPALWTLALVSLSPDRASALDEKLSKIVDCLAQGKEAVMLPDLQCMAIYAGKQAFNALAFGQEDHQRAKRDEFTKLNKTRS